MHPIGQPRREHLFISADDVSSDAHLGDRLYRTELVRQSDTGVQRNRLPDRGNPVLLHPLVTEEMSPGVGTVNFKPLIAVGVFGGTEVVQDAA